MKLFDLFQNTEYTLPLPSKRAQVNTKVCKFLPICSMSPLMEKHDFTVTFEEKKIQSDYIETLHNSAKYTVISQSYKIHYDIFWSFKYLVE